MCAGIFSGSSIDQGIAYEQENEGFFSSLSDSIFLFFSYSSSSQISLSPDNLSESFSDAVPGLRAEGSAYRSARAQIIAARRCVGSTSLATFTGTEEIRRSLQMALNPNRLRSSAKILAGKWLAPYLPIPWWDVPSPRAVLWCSTLLGNTLISSSFFSFQYVPQRCKFSSFDCRRCS